jgi:hypothetical protein
VFAFAVDGDVFVADLGDVVESALEQYRDRFAPSTEVVSLDTDVVVDEVEVGMRKPFVEVAVVR